MLPAFSNWHHAPRHSYSEVGSYMVTGSTLHKEHYFASGERLRHLTSLLIDLSQEFGWELQAWAVFSNHYHFVGYSSVPTSLKSFIQALHSKASIYANELDGMEGRQVLYQYWDTHLTFEKSYYARLRYVHENPARHRLARNAAAYPFCSAGWFAQKANASFQRKLATFKIDKLKVQDDFEPIFDEE